MLLVFICNDLVIPQGIVLADEGFNQPSEFSCLIGTEHLFDIFGTKQIRVPNSNFRLINSKFVYVVTGSYIDEPCYFKHCFLSKRWNTLDKTLCSFWETENLSEEQPIISDELFYCEKHFGRAHFRKPCGRYSVSLPFNENIQENVNLGDSRSIASKRLDQLWRRLDRDPKLNNLYTKFIEEYLSLDHMEEVTNIDDITSEEGFFLLQHGIFRTRNRSRPLRASRDSSPSETFPKKVLWKKGLNEPVQIFKLKTVTYGTTPACYLSTRVLKLLSLGERENFTKTADIVLHDVYLDNILSGCSRLNELESLKTELTQLFKSAGMSLHKWCFSHSTNNFPDLHFDQSCEESITKILGFLWKCSSDNFCFKVSPSTNHIFTKRDVLSQIARIFDPLGLLGPVISKAKFFMQQLWFLKLEWHEKLPVPVAAEWASFVQSLPVLKRLKIPRFVLSENLESIILYGFIDASEKGFGAVTYVSVIKNNGDRHSKLLCSKSKVAPLKTLTIPRLELSPCLLLFKLIRKVINALKMNLSQVILFSDSTIALSWIKTPPHLLKTFVANRVAKIQELTVKFSWHHISSQNNPADLVSRCLSVSDLTNSPLWWKGPDPSIFKNDELLENINDCEVKKEFKIPPSKNLLLSSEFDLCNHIISITNNYCKLIHVISFIFRFLLNARSSKNKRVSGPLFLKEINQAELWLIKLVQKAEFSNEIKTLLRGDLPKERVTPSYPFNNCGVDFCGPFMVKFKNQRKGVLNKVYVTIFVCLSTKAIHLDFVSDLISKAFIACLKIFFGRRGKSSKMFSDNGKTFVVANIELKKLHDLVKAPDETLVSYFNDEHIDWNFIPPWSPNFGGLWESDETCTIKDTAQVALFVRYMSSQGPKEKLLLLLPLSGQTRGECREKCLEDNKIDLNKIVSIATDGDRRKSVVILRNQTTVMRICDRWMQEGITDRRGRSHPPQCTTSSEDRQIARMTVTDHSVTSRTVAQHIETVTHYSLSARIIRRRLQQRGLSARRPLLCLPLTQNHRRLRRQWCDERRMWAAEWNEVVFTDESRTCLHHHDGRVRIWRHRGERMLNSHVMHHHDGRVRIWRHRARGCLTATLCTTTLGLATALFQQDNAQPHVARIVQRFFVNHQIELLPWPARPPDLSPIENMWFMVAQRLTQIAPPAVSPDQLWQREEANWSAVPQEHIQSLFESMPRRVAVVFSNNGGYSSY
ncbi:integrase catalytic domain-containing protein [Trichonephila clavipes]|nr:integrase catalytic domain-containing protein [Trichonephila clavipes]